jgi:transcriptional regulator with XRE-family HTH domain
MTSELPEPWRTQAAKLNLELSYRGLARATGLGVETVRQAIIGKNRKPSPATVRKLAEVLRMTPAELDAFFGHGGSNLEPYEAPAASARLTPKQRKALDSLILAMVEPEERQRPHSTGSGKTETIAMAEELMRVRNAEAHGLPLGGSEPAEGPPQDAYGLAANTQRLGPSPKRARRAQAAAEESQEENPTPE